MKTIASSSSKLQRYTRCLRAIQTNTGLSRQESACMLMDWLYEDGMTWEEIATELDA